MLAQAAYPGWRAWAAGREAELSVRDGFLQRLAVPEDGRFVPVRVRFDPPLWKAALAFSAAAMTALLAWTRNSFTS